MTEELTEEQNQEQIDKMGNLGKIYEDLLEKQMKILYVRLVRFISDSQIPLVHINSVLDLVKQELLTQLRKGYFGEKK